MNLPQVPRTYGVVTPMDALAKTADDLIPALAKALAVYFKRVPGAGSMIAGIHRSDGVWVCGTRDAHGKTAKTAAQRLAQLLGVPAPDANLTWVHDIRWCDGRTNRDFSIYLADFSRRFANPAGSNITVLVVSRKYVSCWYGTHFPYDRLENAPSPAAVPPPSETTDAPPAS